MDKQIDQKMAIRLRPVELRSDLGGIHQINWMTSLSGAQKMELKLLEL